MAVAVSGPIVLIGAGNMGGAMLGGWLKSGVKGGDVLVIDPGPPPAMAKFIADNGVSHATSVPEGVKAGVVFLAIKPQIMDAVLPPLKGIVGPETVIVSVAAGKTLRSIESHLGEAATVRAMPNTPAMIGRGVTGAYANARVTEAQRALVHDLLRVRGQIDWVETEADIDAVT
ncbi:NAD(P)-binding domain-containing protein, partial [Sinorhizobium sp. 6-117]|uniref:NAD(P)-binding domain-containing protein n=1 Tax=Sinorhizobium sp. 6-117 TaxID=3049090 RepID=UPI0024C40453